MNIVTFSDGRPAVAVLDSQWAEFQSVEYGAYTPSIAKTVDAPDGRVYALAESCPINGYPVWVSAGSPEEQAKDAALAALAPEVRTALGLDAVKTRSERIAQKQADDAEANARASAKL
jgi:hypothetical protein